MSEDPDLTVLEDDVRDFYVQSLATDATTNTGGGGGGERGEGTRFGRGGSGLRRDQQQQQPLRAVPVRVVHYQSSPLPCFSGVGLVHQHHHHPPEAPTALRAAAAVAADEGAPLVPPPKLAGGAVHNGTHADADLPGGDGPFNGSSGGGGCLVVGDWKKPPIPGCGGCGSGSGGRSGCGGEFVALIEAFARKGRADLGVENIRRRGGPGGKHELAVFDDIHARLKIRPAAAAARDSGSGGAGGVVPAAFGARELGIRTSMSTGNRWTIGRVLRAEGNDGGDSGSGCGNVLGGEVYTTIEAPIMSVGDARAASRSAFADAACHGGLGKAAGAGDSGDGAAGGDGAKRSRSHDIGRGRRRYLR